MLADTNPKMRGYFNPRSREGSDFTCRLKGSCINISIRAPTRGATIIGMLLTLSSRFQSALPRGERLVSVQIVILQLKISIRAPARGATLPPFPHSRPYVISIRAPARGATYAYRMYQTDTEISIRAPARGATLYAYRLGRIILFQSALPRGERLTLVYANILLGSFQSALPRGERHSTQPNLDWTLAFQSALPRGERHRSVQVFPLSLLISIRAPARGATFWLFTYSSRSADFNPRSREGSDEKFILMRRTQDISIRAPARGATSGSPSFRQRAKFQSALPRGERRWERSSYRIRRDFNPRSREGSDFHC